MQRQHIPFRKQGIAGLLLGVCCWWGAGLGQARASEDKPAAKSSNSSEEISDPMEMVRERLKDKLGKKAASEDPSTEPLDPEEEAMERLRVRLVRRLSQPSELHVTLRAPSASNVEAARQAAHTPKGTSSGGRAAVVARGSASSRIEGAPQIGSDVVDLLPWSYQGPRGPAAWGRLNPEFSLCASGKRQSPIDVREGIPVNLEPLTFEYHPSAIKVRDDGRGIQALVAPGNRLSLRGRQYELRSVRFHTPAQEHIDGKVYDMSAEFTHRDRDGQWLVLVLLLEKGAAHPGIQQVLDHLPLDREEEVAVRNSVDWGALMPPDRGYYIYTGSLTEPPCTEGVVRVVLRTPATLSPQQHAIFSRLYPMNVRPVQPLAGRVVKQSN